MDNNTLPKDRNAVANATFNLPARVDVDTASSRPYTERPYSDPISAPQQNLAEGPMPSITALGFPSLYAEETVKFSMPPLSAIMSLPLLQPLPAALTASIPPPTLSTEPLRLTRVPLADNFPEQRQNMAPPPQTLTNYMRELKRTRERQALSRAGHKVMPFAPFAPKVPSRERKTYYDEPEFGRVVDALAILPQVSVSLPPVGLFSTAPSSTTAASQSSQPVDKQLLSTVEEPKAGEETDGLFVTQYKE